VTDQPTLPCSPVELPDADPKLRASVSFRRKGTALRIGDHNKVGCRPGRQLQPSFPRRCTVSDVQSAAHVR
jgi:hypothetical protein